MTIASQDGSAHEDKSIEEFLAFTESIYLGGSNMNHNNTRLYKIGSNIKNIGFDFLKNLEEEGKYQFKRTVINTKKPKQ